MALRCRDWFAGEADREPTDAERIGASLGVAADRARDERANWLADLSVEVCKVDGAADDADEEASRHSVSVSGEASSASASAAMHAATSEASDADWHESVFFEAAHGAASGHVLQSASAGVGGRLDVLLGNPNLHHSSTFIHPRLPLFSNAPGMRRLFKSVSRKSCKFY